MRLLLSLVFLLAGMLAASPARAELRIDITKGNAEPLPLAIAPLTGDSPQANNLARVAVEVIRNDLVTSGLFRMIDPVGGVTVTSADGEQDFAAWRRLKADALVTGEISYRSSNDSLQIAFRLFDLHTRRQMIAYRYDARREDLRRVAHIAADAIYHRLTGEKGYFDSRIVFIGEEGSKIRRRKTMMIMDQDSYNPRPLTGGTSLAITPRFSPVAQEITYVSYASRRPRVYVYNLESGLEEEVRSLKGMSFAPRFSPDGRKLVMSMERQGNTDLYTVDMTSGDINAISNTPAIDTAPSYSPDGKFITFESDRGGSQQIYVMRADGTRPRRISFGKGSYGTPVWSPRGDLIAFTKQSRGEFYIGVMRIDGAGERILAQGYHNEAPVWSPNGRVLMFFRETRGEEGGPSLWSVDLTGQNERKIPTPSFASDPAWSPPLLPPEPPE